MSDLADFGIVDSFEGILKQFVVENFLVHVSISHESALEERSSLGCFDRGECSPIIYEFFLSGPADFSVVGKFVGRPALEWISSKYRTGTWESLLVPGSMPRRIQYASLG